MIPIVIIESAEAPGGCVIINESDFDPKTMKLFQGESPLPEPEAAAIGEAPKDEMIVKQIKGLFFVVKGMIKMSEGFALKEDADAWLASKAT